MAGNNSVIANLFSLITDLLTQHASTFEAMGLNLFRGFALILLVWFGIQTALASASGRQGGLPFDRFASLLLTIAFGFAMLKFYSSPIPGIGRSFYHLVTDQSMYLANQLSLSTAQELDQRLNAIYDGMSLPTLALSVIEIIHYVVVCLCILAAEAAITFVLSFGYIAMAIGVLTGPIFIPFFIVPQLEWLFWGWLKFFLQYAFYPVIAYAYLFVFGNLLIHVVDSHPPPYDGVWVTLFFFPLVCLLLAFTIGIAKIPTLVSSVFSGRSGDSVLPRVGSWL